MIDMLLHSGSGHPELLWIVLAGVLALAAGLAIGIYSDRIRSFVDTTPEESPDQK